MSYIDRRQQQASQMAMFKNLSEQTNGGKA